MLLKIDPCPKPRMTRSDAWKKRPAVTRYWKFADKLRKLVEEESAKSPVKPSGTMILSFGIPFPKSASKKFRAENVNKPHRQKPDIDNLAKAVMDVLYSEDSHIHELHLRKLWSEEGYINLVWAP